MAFSRTAAFLLVPAFAAACATATPPPPPPIQGQPIYNKYGEQVGCEEGVFIPGAQQQQQCLPPPRENCDPNAVTYAPDCRPPGKDDEPNNPNNVGVPRLVTGPAVN